MTLSVVSASHDMVRVSPLPFAVSATVMVAVRCGVNVDSTARRRFGIAVLHADGCEAVRLVAGLSLERPVRRRSGGGRVLSWL